MKNNSRLQNRSDVHLARKAWHFIGVLMIAALYNSLSRPMVLQLFSFTAAVSIFIDLYRQRSPGFNKFVISIMRYIMRESEKESIAGTTYLFLGVLLIVAVFPTSVVTLSLFFLAVADPIASYFGIRYGKDKLVGNKTLQGSMAAFFVCTLVAAGYFLSQNMMTERILVVSLLSGLIGAIAEALPVGNLDDNFVLPVVSACLLSLVYFLFGGF